MTWLGFAFVSISFVHIHGVIIVPLFVGEGRRVGVLKIRQFSWKSYVYLPQWFLPVNGFYPLTIFLKKPIIDASYGLKYALREIISLERFDLVKTNFTKSVFDPSKPPPPILRKKS